jgi:hypothetical protein
MAMCFIVGEKPKEIVRWFADFPHWNFWRYSMVLYGTVFWGKTWCRCSEWRLIRISWHILTNRWLGIKWYQCGRNSSADSSHWFPS